MKHTHGKRILSMILVICLMLGMIPTFVSHVEVEAEAVSGLNSLTCAGFISNTTRRQYIDTMMRYYINSSSNLQSALNSGKSAVFMFEGGSDYYDTYKYVDGSGQIRLQAVCIVVQLNSSGNASIVFYSENCSSIPDNANYVTPGYETSGSTTILDGIYKMTTVNHNGNYAAHTTNCYTGWYTPYAGTTGYSYACNGINLHTRGINYCQSGGGNSMGCQLIGYGANSSNEYNTFMKVVAGISFNAYDGTQRTLSPTDTYTGYYVVDRQLGLLSPDGTEYGSGSLTALYTKADLAGITAFSTKARANADFGYLSECTPYASHGLIEITGTTPVNSLPCSTDTDDSETIETASVGDTYTATKLYKNSYGNLWYEVKTKSGETGYIYGGDTVYVKELTSDITLTGAEFPNGHVAGNKFYVRGTIKSDYNQLTTAAVYIHSGFGTSGTKVTGDSDTVSGNSYTLVNSNIDYNTAFDAISTGKYTYAISASYTNHYAEGATTLKTNTGTIYLAEEYFVVVPSSVTQSSCSHSNTTTTVKASTCTETGITVTSCSKCGLVSETTTAAKGHSYGSWTTVSATCTANGSRTRTCSACGNKETQTINATHKYGLKIHAATCMSYAIYEYTCTACGDNYKLNTGEMTSQWIEAIPAGMSSAQFNTKTQYRYANCTSTSWEQSGIGTINYVNSWPSGFDTSNSLYTQYNKKSSKVTASEAATTKTVINSDKLTGYLYYHWCSTSDTNHYSYASKSSTHNIFHAYYSTTSPDNYRCDTSDMSYKTSDSCCSNGNSEWFFVTEVYGQSYTSYRKVSDGKEWGSWSAWSDTVYTAVANTRKVETRTVYQLRNAQLSDHNYVNGICTVCGTTTDGAVREYYLFGYINGADYACEGDAANIGEYKFVNGKLTATFTEDSYVAVKTGDNANWYMTNGWVGEGTTSATLYNTTVTGENSDKIFVPGGVEVTFTLVDNGDDTLSLSYVAAEQSETKDSKDIKWQITRGTSASSASTNLRLVSWVSDVDDYESVTFNVTINGRTVPLVCTTAYTAIKASGLSISNPAGIFGEASANYFVTYTINGIPAALFDSEILVTVTWTDLEGNSVTSDVEGIVISNDWA